MTTKINILLGLLMLPLTLVLAEDNIAADPERMEQRIKALSEHGANVDGGVDRVAFSVADLAGRAYIMDLMKGAGLDTSVDTAGNIIGRREGSEAGLPPILFGSHIDSVPGGGNYDGDVGVIGAIEVIELLEARSIRTRHPLEVVVFSDEEGGLTGSRAMVGKLTDKAGMQADYDMLFEAYARVRSLTEQGMTADEIVATNPLAEYVADFNWQFISAERLVRTIYRDMGAPND